MRRSIPRILALLLLLLLLLLLKYVEGGSRPLGTRARYSGDAGGRTSCQTSHRTGRSLSVASRRVSETGTREEKEALVIIAKVAMT